MPQSSHRIGFISTRFAGTDGVSLETQKWATVLERLGHQCFYFAGECDRNPNQSYVVPEAFYRHPEIDKINQQAYSGSWTVTKEARRFLAFAAEASLVPQDTNRVTDVYVADRDRPGLSTLVSSRPDGYAGNGAVAPTGVERGRPLARLHQRGI